MNARFVNKRTPVALAEALASATSVPVTKVPTRRSKRVNQPSNKALKK